MTHEQTATAPEANEPFEARFILDVGGAIAADLTALNVRRNPLTDALSGITWTNAPEGRSLKHLDLSHVVAIITETPSKEASHE